MVQKIIVHTEYIEHGNGRCHSNAATLGSKDEDRVVLFKVQLV
jgi:hypothetical protein